MMMTTIVVARPEDNLNRGARLVMIRPGLRRKTQCREKHAGDATTKSAASEFHGDQDISGESNDFVPTRVQVSTTLPLRHCRRKMFSMLAAAGSVRRDRVPKL
jgi:hypothetical protein